MILKIKDTGVGIAPDNINKLFEPFHTTKPSGTGLGLAITHKILESHQAKVMVESEVGAGTTFTIEFFISDNPLGHEMKLRKEA